MLRRCVLCLLALSPLAAPVAARAEDQVALGWGRLFNNDFLADMQDRWHTGSYSVSQMRGLHWRGTLPTRMLGPERLQLGHLTIVFVDGSARTCPTLPCP